MPINFTCPHCGKQMNVGDEYAGQSGPCAACGQTIQIPGSAYPASMKAHPSPKHSGAAGGMVAVLIVVLAVGGVMTLACGGILVALMLPAVQAAREAARRSQCSNNLRQIGLAMHNYHDVYGSFPPAYVTDEDGRPLYSWRVLLLPFLEQAPLYNAWHLDEPWDSPHNSAFSQITLSVFNCPSDPDPSGNHTNYMVVTGPGTMFVDHEAISMRELRDGTSNTILVVEVVGQGSSWAEPIDLDFDRLAMSPDSIHSLHPGGANVLMADGSVRFLTETIDPPTLRAMITPAGGEAVRFP